MAKSSKTEVFFSTDIEADGPYPGDFSMLSFASVAFAEDGTVLGSFETNLRPLEGAQQNPDTMTNFWAKETVAWEYVTRNPQVVEEAMTKYVEWVDSIPGDLKTMVCMPAGFDFMFMYWYMKKFAGRSPFSFSCIDMKTFAMAFRRQPYRYSGKRAWPKRWFTNLPHTHLALDDALEQGITFMLMRAESLLCAPGKSLSDATATVRDRGLHMVEETCLSSWEGCHRVSLVGDRAPGVPVPPVL